jgi:hypothetical protein
MKATDKTTTIARDGAPLPRRTARVLVPLLADGMALSDAAHRLAVEARDRLADGETPGRDLHHLLDSLAGLLAMAAGTARRCHVVAIDAEAVRQAAG